MGKMKFNLFHGNVEPLLNWNNLTDQDFYPASEEEKRAPVEERKRVSHWRAALRRFRANRVSMAALFVLLLIALFAFAGPYCVQYGYEEQYRGSAKLGPMEFSRAEEAALEILKEADGVYAIGNLPGSMAYIAKGDYYIRYRGTAYAFHLPEPLEDVILALDADGERPLYYVNEGSREIHPIEYTSAIAEGAREIALATSVFPHIFGTDSSGRDLMARCMYGTRVSLIIGIAAALIVLVIGAAYGAVSGLAGGRADFVMMRVVDLIYSVPDVLIVLLLQVVLKEPLQNWFDASNAPFARAMSDLGVGVVSILITFALLYWVGMARVVRGQVLILKRQEYVTAARALGVRSGRIITRHLLPNCAGQLVVTTCLQIPSAIFLESFLSYLGMGVSAPMASLGSLCSDALDAITLYPYRLLFPAAILTALVLSLNLVGDGLRDALDPRLKK